MSTPFTVSLISEEVFNQVPSKWRMSFVDVHRWSVENNFNLNAGYPFASYYKIKKEFMLNVSPFWSPSDEEFCVQLTLFKKLDGDIDKNQKPPFLVSPSPKIIRSHPLVWQAKLALDEPDKLEGILSHYLWWLDGLREKSMEYEYGAPAEHYHPGRPASLKYYSYLGTTHNYCFDYFNKQTEEA